MPDIIPQAFINIITLHFIIMIHDITRRKKAELELIKHEEDLEEVVRQRTAALEDTNKKLQLALCKVKLLRNSNGTNFFTFVYFEKVGNDWKIENY